MCYLPPPHPDSFNPIFSLHPHDPHPSQNYLTMPNILCSSVNATTGVSEVNASNCDTLLAATHFKVDNAKR
jgi:hypothetical protein